MTTARSGGGSSAPSAIGSDRALQLVGAAIAFTHVLCFVWWRTAQPLEEKIASSVAPICWPFFDAVGGCRAFRVLDAREVVWLAWTYGAVAVFGVVLFLARRPRSGGAVLVVLTVVKAAILMLDLRLRLNQHLMILMFTVVFLAWPRKRDALRLLVVLFYVAAGALKLNREWLSGAALYDVEKLWLPPALVPAACAYVVVLELVLVWGMFARSRLVFFATLAQLALFHAFSWPLVGFLYPLVMASLLAVFVIARAVPAPPALGSSFRAGSIAALVLAFVALQAVPLVIHGDAALTGEGRLLALHMFDARIECRPRYVARYDDGRTRELPVPTAFSWREHCDPAVVVGVARNYCAQIEHTPGTPQLDVTLRSRHETARDLITIIDVRDFCRVDPRWRLFAHDEWLTAAP